MKRFYLTFLLILLSFSAALAQEDKGTAYDRVMQSGTLRCGYFVWPPYFEKDPLTGEMSGIYYDVLEELGKILNLKIDWTYEYTLGQQVEALKSGKMDALCADGPFTRSAMPFVEYSNPYVFFQGFAYIRKGNSKIKSFSDLNSETVTFVSIDGDGSAEYLDLYFPKAKVSSLPSTSDPSLLGKNVLTGKVDAMLNDPISLRAYPQEDQDQLQMLKSDNPLATAPLVISTQKSDRDLVSMLNQGIDLMNDVGLLTMILEKYDPSGEILLPPHKRYSEK